MLIKAHPAPIPRRATSTSFQVSQGHEYEANATAPMYLFHLSEDYKYWLLMRSDTIEYVSQRGWLENTPPSTGKNVLPADLTQAMGSLVCIGGRWGGQSFSIKGVSA